MWFFFPSWVGNAAPVLMARYRRLEWLNKPVDGGIMVGSVGGKGGQRLFGATKTWRGIVSGALFGAGVGLLQFWLLWICVLLFVPGIEVHKINLLQVHNLFAASGGFPWFLYANWQTAALLGFLLGLGEGLGDLAKSFVKRRLGKNSSAACFPLDQLSFLGALALGAFVYFPPWEYVVVIVVLSLIIPVVANKVAYKWGWKKVPW